MYVSTKVGPFFSIKDFQVSLKYVIFKDVDKWWWLSDQVGTIRVGQP